jgi:hypothetical protein
MIKFFRKIRQKLLTENRLGKYLLYALGEIVLVMIGILLALQVSNWNEERKNGNEQYFLLEKLQSDLASDMIQIKSSIHSSEESIENNIFCLDVLSRKRDSSREEFMLRFGDILAINYFHQNTTTFDNLVSSGSIELIENQALLDFIVAYYNEDYSAWDSAMKDYTRNIMAPYIMSYDHLPQMDQAKGMELGEDREFFAADISSFDVKPKTLDDYRQNIFIINALRQKIFNHQGQGSLYVELQEVMEGLFRMIEEEKQKLKKD